MARRTICLSHITDEYPNINDIETLLKRKPIIDRHPTMSMQRNDNNMDLLRWNTPPNDSAKGLETIPERNAGNAKITTEYCIMFNKLFSVVIIKPKTMEKTTIKMPVFHGFGEEKTNLINLAVFSVASNFFTSVSQGNPQPLHKGSSASLCK